MAHRGTPTRSHSRGFLLLRLSDAGPRSPPHPHSLGQHPKPFTTTDERFKSMDVFLDFAAAPVRLLLLDTTLGDCLMTTPCAVVVHLVHGTWPFGPFGRSSGNKKAWFENGSAVRKSIEDRITCKIQFREFRWSGRNSFSARQKAAAEFNNHLDNALRESPETMHLIIAHSHGGTVAAQTIAHYSPGIRGECRIKALVCLATPFPYLSSDGSSRREEYLFFGAVGSIITALVALAFTPLWTKTFEFNPWVVFALALLGPLLFPMPFLLLRSYAIDTSFFPGLHSSIPILLIRATRDEAALTIGLAQSLHALFHAVYEAYDAPLSIRSVARAFFACVAFVIFTIIGFVTSIWVAGDHLYDHWQNRFLILTFASGAAGLVYLGSYALIALMVGFTNLRSWPATVEVDAAPPNTVCAFKSYSDLGNIEATSLRHGIYELPDVQREIASIIQSIADGATPRLKSEEQDALIELSDSLMNKMAIQSLNGLGDK